MHINRVIPPTSGVGPTQAYAISVGPNDYNGTLHVIVAAGTPTYSLEVSNDGVVWYTFLQGLTEDSFNQTNPYGPANFFRINVTDATGGGSVRGVIYEVC